MSKVIIANAIMAIYFLGGLYADTVINRRKRTLCWMCLHLVAFIGYILLDAKSGMYGALWASCKFAIVLFILHRNEEKIIQSPLEVTILGLPYLIIGILNWQEGIFAILNSIASFVNSCQNVCKSDINKQRIHWTTNVFHGLYSFFVMDYTGTLSYICSVVIGITNVFRLKKNGEQKYYK